MLKLLVIGMNYAPERTGIALFTTGLCEYLALRGHSVTVATTFPHYPEWQTHAAYKGKWVHTETREGVTVHRRAVYLPKKQTTLRRVLYDTTLGTGALLSGLGAQAPDLILAVLPPIQAGVAARVLARWKRVPYVFWMQDLALEAALSVGMLRESLAYRIARRLEQWAYAGAAQVLVISEGFQETLRRSGVPPHKLTYLPNWASAEFSTVPQQNGFRREYGIDENAVLVIHAGNMGVKQQLENVLRAAEQLRTRPEIEFVLVGDGSQRKGLLEYAQHAQLRNVRFLPLVPGAQVPTMMASADILLLNQHPDIVEAVIPSKLISYMAAARPIVVAAHPDSEAARQVRAADCGLCVAADQPAALAGAVIRLAEDSTARTVLGHHGRTFAVKYFERETLLLKYEQALLGVVNS